MIDLSIGAAWPYPIAGEGMQAIADPRQDGLDLMLVCTVSSPTPREQRFLLREPIRIALLTHGQIVWIVLAAESLSLDAPYALGVSPPERAAAIRAAAGQSREWPETYRRLLTLVLVDMDTGTVRGIRAVTLSRSWWCVLADGLDATDVRLSSAQHAAAIDAGLVAYPAAADMLRVATIIESAGRL